MGFEPADPSLGLPPGAGRAVPFFNPYGDGSNGSTNSAAVLDYIAGSGSNVHRYNVNSFNAGANGAVFSLPAGSVRLAVGGELRGEKYFTNKLFDVADAYRPVPSTDNATSKRTVSAGYAELLVPFFSEANARAGLQSLDLSLAVRTERYSDGDIGSSTNPKVGIQWRPVSSLALRGSWGTSFKAPRLQQLNEGTNIWRGDEFPNPDAVPGDPSTSEPGFSHFIYLSGFGNKNLKPETAETLSLGFDFTPPELAGFRTSVTYYSIKYKERLLFPTDLTIGNALARGDINDVVLARHPTQAQIDALYNSDGSAASAAALAAVGLPAGTYLIGSEKLPAEQIFAIFRFDIKNFGAVNLNGWDIDSSYAFSNRLGQFTVGASASYLTQYEVQESKAEPFLDLLSTSSSPVALRGRASLGWSRGSLNAALAVNHIGGYDNTTRGDRLKVDPWTTADLHLAYLFNGGSALLDRVSVGLDVQNLFNQDPPFVDNAQSNVGFDPELGSPLGRIIALTVRKTW
jgi:iron complex outermembrane recepter protein